MKFLFPLSSLFIIIIFSGCGGKFMYEPEYISKEVNPYYSKVNTYNIDILEKKTSLNRNPEGAQFKTVNIEINVGEVNTNVSKEFFQQYFNKVDIVPNIKSQSAHKLSIDSTINDFSYKFNKFSDGSEVSVSLTINVYKDGQTILSKIYNIRKSNEIIWSPFRLTKTDALIELFHKTVLSIYENEFKKDLVDAL